MEKCSAASLQLSILIFNHHEVIPQYARLGIFHIASAIFHISKGNISLSRQGKYHWAVRKSLSALLFGVSFLRSIFLYLT
jgi:hypothetical protein